MAADQALNDDDRLPWLGRLSGELAVIFPQELHRPMCTLGEPSPLRKIVVKIASLLLVA